MYSTTALAPPVELKSVGQTPPPKTPHQLADRRAALDANGSVLQRKHDFVPGLQAKLVAHGLGDDNLTLLAYLMSHTAEYNSGDYPQRELLIALSSFEKPGSGLPLPKRPRPGLRRLSLHVLRCVSPNVICTEMARRAAKRRDEEDSFREAFRELFPVAYRVAWRFLGDAEAAEDCAAEALARAFARWRHVATFPHRDAWVLRVTSNLAIDVVRQRVPLLDPPRPTEIEDITATRLALAAALRALPGRQRDAVVLRYMHGYSETEVADALGVSAGTVKTHLRRGLDALRTKLNADFGRSTLVV